MIHTLKGQMTVMLNVQLAEELVHYTDKDKHKQAKKIENEVKPLPGVRFENGNQEEPLPSKPPEL